VGYGQYSHEAHVALTDARKGASQQQVFGQSSCHPLMSPRGVKHRESRDSPGHPRSLGVIFALDVSSSMEAIPVGLATRTLPTFMKALLAVEPDAQVMFMAFGNAYSDRSPLQVGQFESEAHLVDRWLSLVHIESGGGGFGESYDLAMYFAARHTKMDCLEQRAKKGYLFMTGDEVAFEKLDPSIVRNVIGDEIPAPILGHDLVTELLRSFYPFFLVPDARRAGQCHGMWAGWLHERAVVLERPEDTAIVAALLVAIQEGVCSDVAAIERFAAEKLGLDADVARRVVGTVTPFAHALARGPIAGPRVLGVSNRPGFRG
jgi:hypothetical protein